MSQMALKPESARRLSQWDRQAAETSKQFEVFREYRDMHPLDRSLAKVGRKLGRSTTYVERLSTRFGWVERVAGFDREQDRLAQARHIRSIEQMNERHARVAEALFRKIAEWLETMDTTALRPNHVARLLDVASRVERMARGVLPDETAGQQQGFPIINADELRPLLKEHGLLANERCHLNGDDDGSLSHWLQEGSNT